MGTIFSNFVVGLTLISTVIPGKLIHMDYINMLSVWLKVDAANGEAR